MFVALALLNSTRGKDAETRELGPVKVTTSEVIVKGGQLTIRDVDLTEKGTLKRIAPN